MRLLGVTQALDVVEDGRRDALHEELVHICCAPCAVYPFHKLRHDFEEAMGFWYNPNIHPFLEYQRRLKAVKVLTKNEEMRVIYKDDYDIKKFLRQVVYRELQRCLFCYYDHLEKTAIFAHQGGFDYFGSTLFLSPHQDQELLKTIIETISNKYGIKPYLKEIEGGRQKGAEFSRKMKLYRQEYCGCIYGEEEKYKIKHQEKKNRQKNYYCFCRQNNH